MFSNTSAVYGTATRKSLLKDVQYIGAPASDTPTSYSSAEAEFFFTGTAMPSVDTAISRRMWASSLISALPSFLFG